MPPGHGSGRPAQDLADDPIEDYPPGRRVDLSIKVENRYLPVFTDTKKTDAEIINRPSVLQGGFGPRNSLHSSPTAPSRTTLIEKTKKRKPEVIVSHQSPTKRNKTVEKKTSREGASKTEARPKENLSVPYLVENRTSSLDQSAGEAPTPKVQSPAIIDSSPSSPEDNSTIVPHFNKDFGQVKQQGKRRAMESLLEKIPHDSGPQRKIMSPLLASHRWASGTNLNGQSVGSTTRKRDLVSRMKLQKWGLVTFQRGNNQCDPKLSGSEINLKAERPLRANARLFVSSNEKFLAWSEFPCEDIGKVYYETLSRRFIIKLESHPSTPGHHLISFVVRSEDDFESLLKYMGDMHVKIKPGTASALKKLEEDSNYYLSKRSETLVKDSDENDKSFQVGDTRITETSALRTTQTLAPRRSPRQSTRTLSDNTVSLAPIPRKTRSQAAIEEVAIKRSHEEFSIGNSDEEIRSAKVPKLSLPNPPWSFPLLYPFEGPKRANVEFGDLKRLNDAEFLNDNLINFYLRYLEEELHSTNQQLAKETHFFNTFFYERLSKGGINRESRMQAILKWTSKIDLFRKNYIIMPINENTHWYLAIVCNLQYLERKLQKDTDSNKKQPIDTDSDETVTGEKLNRTTSNVQILSTGMSAAGSNEKDVVEAGSGVERMVLDEKPDDWPVDDENEALDPQVELKNKEMQPLGKKSTDSSTSETEFKMPKKVNMSKKKALPPNTPVIIILDSMSVASSRRPTTIKNIKDWIQTEAKVKRGLEVDTADLKTKYPKAPGQDNWYDCGLFLLHYTERFLSKAKDFLSAFLSMEETCQTDMWQAEGIVGMRKRLFDQIVELHQVYEQHERRKALKDVERQGNPPIKINASKKLPTTNGTHAAPSRRPQFDIAVVVDVKDSQSSEVQGEAGISTPEQDHLTDHVKTALSQEL